MINSFVNQPCPYGGWRKHCGKKCIFKHIDDTKENSAECKEKVRQKLSSYTQKKHTPSIAEKVVGIRKSPLRGQKLNSDVTIKDQTISMKKVIPREEMQSKKIYPMEKIQNLNGVYGRKEEYLATGLKNPASTCYMNSVIQVLVNSDQIGKMLFPDQSENEDFTIQNVSLANELRFLSKVMQTGEYKYITPRDFKKVVDELFPKFVGTQRQHDAHEFLTSVLDRLKEETTKRSTSAPVAFKGKYVSTVTCPRCKHASIPKEEEFSTLHIDICESSLNPTVEQGIEKFLEVEKVEWRCDKCKITSVAEKKTGLKEMPELLVIQIKRFSQDKYGIFSKNSRSVNFPDTLTVENSGNIKSNFELVSYIHHTGRTSGGHYTASCRDNVTNLWYKYDDIRVSRCDPNDKERSYAYILFYKMLEEVRDNERNLDQSFPENKMEDPEIIQAVEMNLSIPVGTTIAEEISDIVIPDVLIEEENINEEKTVRRSQRVKRKTHNDIGCEQEKDEKRPGWMIGDDQWSNSSVEKVSEITPSKQDYGKQISENACSTRIDKNKKEELYCCVCRKVYDEKEAMVYCKTCKGWYHRKCIPSKCNTCISKDQQKKDEKERKNQELQATTKGELEAAKSNIKQLKKELKEKEATIKGMKKETANLLKKDEKERKEQEASKAIEIKDLQKQVQLLMATKKQLEEEKAEQIQAVVKLRKEVDMVNEEIRLNALRTRELREQHTMYRERTEKELEDARMEIETLGKNKEEKASSEEELTEKVLNQSDFKDSSVQHVLQEKVAANAGKSERTATTINELKTEIDDLKREILEKSNRLKDQERKAKENLNQRDSEIKGLKIQIVSYEERLETALSNAAQKERENMHIVENHENLKRVYKELLASEEKESVARKEKTVNDVEEEKRAAIGTRTHKKRVSLCRFKDKCQFTSCRYGHPEREQHLNNPAEPKPGNFKGTITEKAQKSPSTTEMCRIEDSPKLKKGVSETEIKNRMSGEIAKVNFDKDGNKHQKNICFHGPSCKYLRSAHGCWFRHPKEHYEKLQDERDKDKEENERQSKFTRKKRTPRSTVAENWITSKKPFFGVSWEHSTSSRNSSIADQRKSLHRNILETQDEDIYQKESKNWGKGMHLSLHSLERRIEERMDKQMSEFREEITKLQVHMKKQW